MVATCSVKEAMARISKVQLLNEISNDTDGNFIFPVSNRAAKTPKPKFSCFDLPSQSEIINTIYKSKSDAINSAIKVGMIPKNYHLKEESCFCQIRKCLPDIDQALSTDDVCKSSKNESTMHDLSTVNFLANICLKNYANKFKGNKIDETSSFVEIPHEKKRFIVRKSSLCWLLSNTDSKLSSDRLLRVRGHKDAKKMKRSRKTKPKNYKIRK